MWDIVKHILAFHGIIFGVFVAVYWYMLRSSNAHFFSYNTPILHTPFVDALYLGSAVHTSMGGADISPRTKTAKLTVTGHVLIAWCITIALTLRGLRGIRR